MWVWGVGVRVLGLGFRVWGVGRRVGGVGCRVEGVQCSLQGAWCREMRIERQKQLAQTAEPCTARARTKPVRAKLSHP